MGRVDVRVGSLKSWSSRLPKGVWLENKREYDMEEVMRAKYTDNDYGWVHY